MIKILLASHNDFSQSLLRTGSMICGRELMSDVYTVSVKEGEYGIVALEKDCREFCKTIGDNQLLILVDIFGATPCNVCLSVFRDIEHIVVSGMNLSMLMETVIKRDLLPLEELAECAIEAGKHGIEKIQLKKSLKEEDLEDFL